MKKLIVQTLRQTSHEEIARQMSDRKVTILGMTFNYSDLFVAREIDDNDIEQWFGEEIDRDIRTFLETATVEIKGKQVRVAAFCHEKLQRKISEESSVSSDSSYSDILQKIEEMEVEKAPEPKPEPAPAVELYEPTIGHKENLT